MNGIHRLAKRAAIAVCALGVAGGGVALAQPGPPAEKCLDLNRIKRTEILDQRNVIFYMRGDKIFRNHLSHRCPGLRKNETIMYRTSMNRLCSLDFITVLRRTGFGFTQGPSCGLGQFYPIDELGLVKLKEQIEIQKRLKKKS